MRCKLEAIGGTMGRAKTTSIPHNPWAARFNTGLLITTLLFSFLFLFLFFPFFLFFSFLNTAWNAAWQLPNAVRVHSVSGTLCSLCWPPCALLIRGLEQNMFCSTRES